MPGAHWADYGFGTPKMVHVIYLLKVFVLFAIVGVTIATLTSGLNPLQVSGWWNQPIVYQKAILWTVLIEILGIGGSWGPLAGHFKPMTGNCSTWLRPNTIRLPPWPETVPFTRGDTRRPVDVAIYALILDNFVVAVVLPGVTSSSPDSAVPDNQGLVNPVLMYPLIALLVVMGLRDKVIFIAARSEQYLPAIVFFGFLQFVDMILALKLLIVTVWVGAGISKLGHHFSMVIPPMLSNTPWIPSRAVKRAHYRNSPEDMRPSTVAGGIGHVLGTLVEVITPLVLLFSTSRWLTLAAVILMVCFRIVIFSTFPLAVPLEWNLLFAYASIFVFWGVPGLGRVRPDGHDDTVGPGGDRGGAVLLPGGRQSPAGPRVVAAIHAAVRRKLGVGNLGVRPGCRGEAGPVRGPVRQEHPHAAACVLTHPRSPTS